MKRLFVALSCFALSTLSNAQSLQINKIWETEGDFFQIPESAKLNEKEKLLYISNIGSLEEEGKGSISKLSLEGKIIDKNWVTGLTAPKGLSIKGNHLYIAEHATIAIVDTKSGKLVRRISVPNAQMLNDVSVSSKGIIYATDSKAGKVIRIENEVVTEYLDGMNGINGLLADNDELLILAKNSLLRVDKNKNVRAIATELEGGPDGVEILKKGEYIVTGYKGTVYHISESGSKNLILDTQKEQLGAADLGLDAKKRILYIPTLYTHKVIAYQLK